jgi:hypothetical protein
MSLFAKPSAASRLGRPLHFRNWFTLTPDLDRDDPSLHHIVWISLAQDALIAGRIGQAEALVEQAYLVCDEAMTNVAADRLRLGEEESELDAE